MPSAVTLFENASDSRDILLRISALTDVPMEKGKTLIFFDEVQECKEIVTAIKFLVEEGSFRYILSGSLLGVELKDIRSIPVGYMSIYEMFPMNFFEFCRANRVSQRVMDNLQSSGSRARIMTRLFPQTMAASALEKSASDAFCPS